MTEAIAARVPVERPLTFNVVVPDLRPHAQALRATDGMAEAPLAAPTSQRHWRRTGACNTNCSAAPPTQAASPAVHVGTDFY